MSGDTVWPAGVYGGVDAIALGAVPSVQALLPAPPPLPESVHVAAAITPVTAPQPQSEAIGFLADEDADEAIAWTPGFKLRHERQPEPAAVTAQPIEPVLQPSTQSWDTIQAMFEGGTDSLVARAVGSAEGTRTPEGYKNPAYFGHVDPGNGVWNLGTFSYQHGASTPEEADAKQLQRLQQQTAILKQKATAKGLELSPEELLNGIDLANQAPLAALDRGGYIDWLQEAHRLGMAGSDAIVWARTRSFLDPDTRRWNAPGLGNNIYSISHDQERRANAIARAIDATGLMTPVTAQSLASHQPPLVTPQTPEPVITPAIATIALDLTLPESFIQDTQAVTAVANASVPAERPPTAMTEKPAEPAVELAVTPPILATQRDEIALTFPKDTLAMEEVGRSPALSAVPEATPTVDSAGMPEAPTDVPVADSDGMSEAPVAVAVNGVALTPAAPAAPPPAQATPNPSRAEVTDQPAGGPDVVAFEADVLAIPEESPPANASSASTVSSSSPVETASTSAIADLTADATAIVLPDSAPQAVPIDGEASPPSSDYSSNAAAPLERSPSPPEATPATTEDKAASPLSSHEPDQPHPANPADVPVSDEPDAIAPGSSAGKPSSVLQATGLESDGGLPVPPFSAPRVLTPTSEETALSQPMTPKRRTSPVAKKPDVRDDLASVLESLSDLQKALRQDH
jgi:hypothetical protein